MLVKNGQVEILVNGVGLKQHSENPTKQKNLPVISQ